MQKKTHIAFGLLIFLILVKYFNMNLTLAVFAALGSIIPDIDWFLDKKYIPNFIKKITWNLIFPVGMHRTIFHNIWALIIMIFIFLRISGSWIATIAFSIGLLSHLIADSLTISGIYWLWPIGDNRVLNQRKKIFFLRGPIKTGTVMEYTFQVSIYIIVGILIAKNFI